jgi:ribosomal protein L11 methylase PrmA
VRVSTHVVLKPPGRHFKPQPQDVVIDIKPGAAFGDGRHPTSRLAVRGIAYVLKHFNPDDTADHSRVLDIGTGLAEQIEISDQFLESIQGPFNLVTANLRYPTLKKISACLRKITLPTGLLVFSGIRSHESAGLIKTYDREGFELLWQDDTHDWAGVALKKR